MLNDIVLGKKISWGIFLLSFICFHAICQEDGVKWSLKDTNFLSNLIILLESSKLLLLWLCTVFQRKVQNILFLIEKCFTFLRPNGGVYMTADRYIENILCTPLSVHRHCKVTNCSPNPDRIGYGPNKPSTINL